MAARIDVTQDDALLSILTRLRTYMGLDDRNCYEVEDANDIPRIPIGGDFWLTVAAGDGEFETGEQDYSSTTERSTFIVTIYTRIQTDSTDHAEQRIHDPDRGLIPLKRRVLQALVGHDPVTSEGDAFVRHLIHAIRATRPTTGNHESSGVALGQLQITFGLIFDWDLET